MLFVFELARRWSYGPIVIWSWGIVGKFGETHENQSVLLLLKGSFTPLEQLVDTLAQASHRPRGPRRWQGVPSASPWVEHTTSQCGARWGATRREGQPRNFSFHVLYPTTRSSTRIAMSMTMGGSARALALLVWLAAIPIAAHAAAEASFEVSQVSGLRGWQPARTAITAKGGEVGAGRVTVSLPAPARWRCGRLRVAASIATKPSPPHGATCRARVPRPHAVLPFRKSHHPALHAHATTEREPWFAYELLQDVNDEALGRCGQRSDAICGRGNQNARGCGCHCNDGDGSDGG